MVGYSGVWWGKVGYGTVWYVMVGYLERYGIWNGGCGYVERWLRHGNVQWYGAVVRHDGSYGGEAVRPWHHGRAQCTVLRWPDSIASCVQHEP